MIWVTPASPVAVYDLGARHPAEAIAEVAVEPGHISRSRVDRHLDHAPVGTRFRIDERPPRARIEGAREQRIENERAQRGQIAAGGDARSVAAASPRPDFGDVVAGEEGGLAPPDEDLDTLVGKGLDAIAALEEEHATRWRGDFHVTRRFAV